MSSSRPYESKVLRFFLSQFQQGLERHRRAMRQAQNTAAWGLQIALSPLQNLAKMAGRQIGTAGTHDLPLLGWFRKNNEPPETALTPSLEPSPSAELNPSQPKKFSVSGLIKASVNFLAPLFKGDKRKPQSAELLTARPKAISKRGRLTPATSSALLEPPIAELLEAIQHWLLPEQRSQLGHFPTDLPLQLPTATRRPTGRLVSPTATSLDLKSATALQGIASDLTTRALILIDLDNTPLELLTQPQQALLKHQISVLMDAYWQYRTRVPSLRARIAARLPARWQPALLGEQPAPAEQWHTHLQQILTGPSINQTSLSAAPIWTSSLATTRPQTATGTSSVSTSTRAQVLQGSKSIILDKTTVNSSTTTQTAPDVLSTYASVIGYVEHPLEKLLRWIDQGLTWLENLWSKLRSWYQLTF